MKKIDCNKCKWLDGFDRLLDHPEAQKKIKKDLEQKGYVVNINDGKLCIGKSYETRRNLYKLPS